MKRTRRVKITKVERRSVRVPAPRTSPRAGAQLFLLRAYCATCQGEVETLTTAQAAEVLEVEVGALRELMTTGHVHAIRTVSGSLRVCKDSLFEPMEHANRAEL